MVDLKEPKDLLRFTYTILQDHTTKTPGPSLKALLQKAGIELVKPPTQQEINARMVTKPATNKLSFINGMKKIAENTTAAEVGETLLETAAAAAAGGGLLNNIRTAVSSSRQLQASLAIVVTGVAIDIVRYAARENDEQTIEFITDSFLVRMAGSLLGYDLYSGVEEIRTQRARDERAAQIRRERFAEIEREFGGVNDHIRRVMIALGNIQDDALKVLPPELNIKTLPIKGDLPRNLRDDNKDTITLEPFAEGDIVAVINEDTERPFLRESLQSWMAACHAQGRSATHPTTRQPFTKDTVTIYRVKAATSGGKRKTKKQLKKHSKKQQNVRSLRKRSRRQIHKKR